MRKQETKVAAGFAYVEFRTGEIDVRTVSETEVAAQVNALVMVANLQVMQGTKDEAIQKAFTRYLGLKGKITPVRISENLH